MALIVRQFNSNKKTKALSTLRAVYLPLFHIPSTIKGTYKFTYIRLVEVMSLQLFSIDLYSNKCISPVALLTALGYGSSPAVTLSDIIDRYAVVDEYAGVIVINYNITPCNTWR